MSPPAPPQLVAQQPVASRPARAWAAVRGLGAVRLVALVAWAVAFVAYCLWRGAPVDRASQTVIILTLLLAANIGNPWRAKGKVLVDWLPFVGFLYLYDYTRGLASLFHFPTRVAFAVDIDKVIGLGQVPTVRLQHWLYTPGVIHWWDVVISLCYFTHFFAVWVIAVVLYLRNREEWARWARRLLTLSYAGLITFIVFPAAPPWFAGREGLIDPVFRLATRGWDWLGIPVASALIQKGQAGVNDVAAIPSLHASFPLLITLFFWQRSGRWMRALLVTYTATMAFSLVYAGEHYVTDILIGYAYTVVTVAGCSAWERRRARRPFADDVVVLPPGPARQPEPAGALVEPALREAAAGAAMAWAAEPPSLPADGGATSG